MVTVDYLGRTGNNIFQYVFARMLAEKNGLYLNAEWPHPEFVQFSEPAPGTKVDGEWLEIRDTYSDSHNQDWLEHNFAGQRIHLHGFWQHPKFYDRNEGMIRKYFKLDKVTKRPPTEVVAHIRLGDYLESKSVISPEWYYKCLNACQYRPGKARGRKFYIVTDQPDHPYLKNLEIMQPIIVSESPAHDFHFIREFDNIICGNSSFSWWASWLSEAKKIFTFSKWMRLAKGEVLHLQYMQRARCVAGNFWQR